VTHEPRLIEPGEAEATMDIVAAVFGAGPVAPDDYRAEMREILEPDRTFAVEDGGRLVGTASAFTFRLALPGGGTVPMAGVTEAGVLPTHRRRGVLSSLVEALHDHAAERGEPVAGLTASEAGIYRRFGYGVATRFQSLALDARRMAEVPEAAALTAPGVVRLVTRDEAVTALPAAWERHWRRTPGEVSRTPGWWRMFALDVAHARDGASAWYAAVHDDPDGEPDGFVLYRLAPAWDAGGPEFELRIVDLAAASPAVEAALVRFAVGVDLVARVTWHGAPADDPLRWRLADPRAVRVTAERDHLWLRPLDVAACLAARRYATAGGLVVEVVDGRRPERGGRFLLDAGADGAACARTDREADVAVRMPELGSLLLGGVSWALLRDAGLVDERVDGAVARADALFRTERAPWCATDF
jgi:predicted acetyltransferase